MIDQEYIKAHIQPAMDNSGKSIDEMAEELGKTSAMVRYYRQGRIFDIRMLERIAEMCGTTVAKMLDLKRTRG